MPQGKKKKSAEDILGIQAPRKSAEEILGTTAPAPQPAQEGPGFFENLKIGASRGFDEYILNPSVALAEAIAAMNRGDLRPLQEMAEMAGRGIMKVAAPLAAGPYAAGNAYQTMSAIQDPKIAEVKARQQARRDKEGTAIGDYFRGQKVAAQRLDERAAQDPSISGKITRGAASGAVAALPLIATGVASGGSVPALAGVAALQSADAPENLPLNVAGAAIPIPVGRVAAPILRRLRGGRGLNVSPEISAASPVVRATGPVEEQQAIMAGLNEIEAAVSQGAKIRDVQTKAMLEVPGGLEANAGTLVAPVEKTPVLETISALRKAGLLTGVKTHLRNVGGTGMFQLSEEVARVPAAIADIAASAITKRRTISGPSMSSMARSGYEAATKGIREAGQIIKNGISEEDLARLQLNTEINSGSKVVDGYVNGVFRLLNAEDRVFRTYAFRRALEDRARSTVLNEIKQGSITKSSFGQRVRELVDNPTEDISAGAIADAEIAVFTNENLISQGLGMVRREAEKRPGGRWVNFATDIVAPFTKTPTNIIARMLEYSPLGFGKSAYQAARGIAKQAFTEAEQRAFAQTFGRASVGSALIALGWKLEEKGLMTGLYEDEPTKRNRDQAAGRMPGAIRVGNTWFQITGFAPLGTLVAIGASLSREANQQREDESEAAGKMFGVAGSAVAEQPLLEGAADVLGMLKGRTSPVEEGGKIAGSFIPTAVSDIGEFIDPNQRQAKGEGFAAQIEKRIPGLRQTLPVATDVLGNPLEDRASQLIDPTRATTAQEARQPLIAELVRLDQGLNKLEKGKGEDANDYRRRVQEFGRLYQTYGLQLINNERYQQATDAVKKKALASFAERVKAQLREQIEKGRRAQKPEVRLNPNEIVRLSIASLTKR
jgi:hypothetical protein